MRYPLSLLHHFCMYKAKNNTEKHVAETKNRTGEIISKIVKEKHTHDNPSSKKSLKYGDRAPPGKITHTPPTDMLKARF